MSTTDTEPRNFPMACCELGSALRVHGHGVETCCTLAHYTCERRYALDALERGRKHVKELTARLDALEAALGAEPEPAE
jgi:hypothetical protein